MKKKIKAKVNLILRNMSLCEISVGCYCIFLQKNKNLLFFASDAGNIRNSGNIIHEMYWNTVKNKNRTGYPDRLLKRCYIV